MSNHSLDEMEKGQFNQVAISVAEDIVNTPNKYPLVYFGSDPGLGKTHILNAIKSGINIKHPKLNISYLTAREYMKEMINSIKGYALKDFEYKYTEHCDVLIIDDLDNLKYKLSTQEDLSRVIKHLITNNKQVIISGPLNISKMPSMNDKIQSCISEGLLINIQNPDQLFKQEFLEKKCEEMKVTLNSEQIKKVAFQFKDMGGLKGFLLKLLVYKDHDFQISDDILNLNLSDQNDEKQRESAFTYPDMSKMLDHIDTISVDGSDDFDPSKINHENMFPWLLSRINEITFR